MKKKYILIIIGLTIALFSCPAFIKSPYFAFLIFGPDAYRMIKANDDTFDFCIKKMPVHTGEQLDKCYEENHPQILRGLAGK